MTATNHVITGSLFISATVSHVPLWLSLPIAFLLHFVLDALPHFGQPDDDSAALRRLKWFLPLDALLGASVLLTILFVQPVHWLAILAGGVLCASPDLWSATRFLRFLRTGNPARNTDWFAQFHHRIQWGERLWGIWIELAWALGFGYVLLVRL